MSEFSGVCVCARGACLNVSLNEQGAAAAAASGITVVSTVTPLLRMPSYSKETLRQVGIMGCCAAQMHHSVGERWKIGTVLEQLHLIRANPSSVVSFN